MKKVLLLLLLFTSFSGFSQVEKDSLLIADKAAILDKLDLMFYLDHVGMEYLKMQGEQSRVESDKTFPYYFVNTIVKNNPSSIDLAKFIGFDFKEYKPVKWKDFLNAVYEKNLNEFIELTEKYGYLSIKRLKRLKDKKADGLVIFVVRNDTQDKKIKKLLKREKKIGNISQKDYDLFKFFLERKKVMTDYDVARFEKNGGKIIKGNP